VQTGEREFHLGLDPGCSRDAAGFGVADQVFEQGGLPDPRVTTDDQHLTVAGADAGDHVVQPGTLRTPPAELGRRPTNRHGSPSLTEG
jgi:hypothetical protein